MLRDFHLMVIGWVAEISSNVLSPGASLEKHQDFALVWPSAIRNIVQGEMSVITIDIDFSRLKKRRC
jgi:hypothetical protein